MEGKTGGQRKKKGEQKKRIVGMNWLDTVCGLFSLFSETVFESVPADDHV